MAALDSFHRRDSSPDALPATALLSLAVSAILLSACGGERGIAPEEEGYLPPYLDSHVAAFDAAAPSLELGRGGSILLGEGWGRAELSRDPPFVFAWALDGRATLDVPRPIAAGSEARGAEDYDLVADLLPFVVDDGGEQRVELWVEGRSVASAVLEGGWQKVRLPLPVDALEAPWTSLELRFARSDRPSDLGRGDDRRRLSAAVREVAAVPRSAGPSSWLRVESTSEEGARWLTFPAGSAWAFPVPPGSRGVLRIASASSGCTACRLRIEHAVEAPEGRLASRVWEGSATELDGAQVPFETPGGRFGRLILSWSGRSGEGSLRLGLGERFLSFEPVPGGDLVGGAEGVAAGSDPPGVFVYLIDTLRADELGPYSSRGASAETLPDDRPSAHAPSAKGPRADVPSPVPTPAVDRFAADGVVYEQAWTPSSWTLPATVSVLTGVYPDRHGIMTGQKRFDGGGLPSLAQRLGEAGYQTLGLSQSYVASQQFGVDRGFDTFVLDDQLNGRALRSQRLRRHFSRWLEDPSREPGRPLFAYLHTVDPHDPYEPVGSLLSRAEGTGTPLPPSLRSQLLFYLGGHGKDPAKRRHLRALYGGEVGYADRQLGRFVGLLEHLGLYRPSLVALLSDHGEEFAEHGGFGHGRTLYEEQLRVPLIVKYPGDRWAGQRVTTPVSTVDLVPTVLDLVSGAGGSLDLDGPGPGGPGLDDRDLDGHDLDGRSLRPDHLARAGPRLLFSEVRPEATEHLAAVDYVAMRAGATKCLLSRGETDQFGRSVPKWRVFDLEEDPAETRPLPESDPRVERCRRQWQRWQELRAGMGSEAASAPVDEEALEQLRALGYIGG